MASLGMPLDEWQEQSLEAAMGERSDGRWASKFVGLSVPRQNGKSQLIVARALAGVLLFGERMIIISAHETDTAREVWKRLIDVVESNPTLEARVTGRMDAINREFLSFGKGAEKQTIKLKARRQSGARGFSADCLLLDEGQILGKQSWGSIVPTMSARPNPQLWLFGTPPTPQDDPFAFARVRASALARRARHCWLEWSAEESDDFDDPGTWAKANPSFGVRISAEACADDRAAMDDGQFALERLGIWPVGDGANAAIPYPAWAELADGEADRSSEMVFGLDVAEDRTAWIVAAWRRADGSAHVSIVDDTALPAFRAAERCSELVARWGGVVVPPRAFEDDLGRAAVRMVPMKAGEFGPACGSFADAVTSGRVRHDDQAAMNFAVRSARWRSAGSNGERAFALKNHPEVGPLAAAVRAVHGLSVDAPSVYEERGVILL